MIDGATGERGNHESFAGEFRAEDVSITLTSPVGPIIRFVNDTTCSSSYTRGGRRILDTRCSVDGDSAQMWAMVNRCDDVGEEAV